MSVLINNIFRDFVVSLDAIIIQIGYVIHGIIVECFYNKLIFIVDISILGAADFFIYSFFCRSEPSSFILCAIIQLEKKRIVYFR